jgi:hypothetical protein
MLEVGVELLVSVNPLSLTSGSASPPPETGAEGVRGLDGLAGPARRLSRLL